MYKKTNILGSRILSSTPTFMSFLILIQLNVISSPLKQWDGLRKEDNFNPCSALYQLCDTGHLLSPSEPWLISVKMLNVSRRGRKGLVNEAEGNQEECDTQKPREESLFRREWSIMLKAAAKMGKRSFHSSWHHGRTYQHTDQDF